MGEAPIRRTRASAFGARGCPVRHSSRRVRPVGFGAGLIPLHSPLLRESLLVSFPPLSDMLKFSGWVSSDLRSSCEPRLRRRREKSCERRPAAGDSNGWGLALDGFAFFFECVCARNRQCARRMPPATDDFADPQTGVAPGVTRSRKVRSRCRCSTCPAIHIK